MGATKLMYNFKIKIAGYVFEVEAKHENTSLYCMNYLTCDPVNFHLAITQEDIEGEKRRIGNKPEENLEKVALHRKLADFLIDYNVFLFHGSALALDGNGYIFTAPSGTGKSTHSRLWAEHFGERCTIINDDKPLLKVNENQLLCYGSPWNGKHRIDSNIVVPVKAIVYLTRDSFNHIEKKRAIDLFDKLFLQTFRPDGIAKREKVFSLLAESVKLVDIYQLGCTMDPQAAVIAYEGMNLCRR